ncbi:catechol 2,3-dioxygenase-like lactoylglutathione lyase family enzyme [Porphyrobacter sp. MBR-155]|jgi:catechol 2,3-dioxygenase-like lactoylglutathione lyase family enzyme|uniref:VOC family protein n=1 Tax=Porphyrobacter sp. MBR-155 TaxID=3156464 RepID=UPI003396D4CC
MMADPLNGKLDVNLRVVDLGASIAWYTRVFGAEPIYSGEDRSKDGGTVPMACFRLGGVKLWLVQGRTPQSGSQRVDVALMNRQLLAPLRALLTARGAMFDYSELPGFPVDADGVRRGQDAEFFFLLNPDGHRIEYCRTCPVGGDAK